MRLLAAVVVLSSALVQAESPLDQARAQHKALQFKEAARTLEALAKTPGLSRAEAASAWFLEGLVKGALADAAGAKDAFVRALLLDPELKLPGRVSPRVATPFLEAKAVAKDHGPLTVELPRAQRSEAAWALTWTPVASLTPWVESVVVTATEDGTARSLAFPAAQGTTLSGRGNQVELRWQALDARGWVVAEGASVLAAFDPSKLPPVAKFGPVPSALPRERVREVAPTTFSKVPGIVGLSLGSFGIAFGAISLAISEGHASEARSATSNEEFRYELARGRSDQVVGGVVLGIGSAVFIAGGVLLGVSLARPRVALVPTAGGGALVFSGVLP